MGFELDIKALPAAAREWVLRRKPRVAVVLGSGFGGLSSATHNSSRVPYGDIEGFPPTATGLDGHAGELVLGEIAGVPAAVFSGRVHGYQGASALDASFPARLAAAMGCETLVVTNASGAVSATVSVGGVVVVSDHVNLTGASPLVGWSGPDAGGPFVPMHDAYDRELRAIAHDVSADLGVTLGEAVYAGVLGPAFETPAEVRYLRAAGADVVGMSTVHEVIAARALGLRVLGLSLVTNEAANPDLSHAKVLFAGAEVQERLARLLAGILSRL